MSRKQGTQPKPTQFRLTVKAGEASPAPPVGPAFGQRGLRAIDFCKQFNAQTVSCTPGTPIPCVVHVNPDRTFTFITKTPSTTFFLKRAAGVEKGATKPGREFVGDPVSLKHVYEIAKIKLKDKHLQHLNLEQMTRTIVAGARSLGIRIVR